ncbi:uncharacterized protein YjdB [Catenulispora sp. GP43]|uniref:Ig-like domain-containing protein n=1 Tax=Catenulispora sp. GP43 TaxID=3156263 RepID=UPI003516D5A5
MTEPGPTARRQDPVHVHPRIAAPDDLPALSVPIADPASHVWQSSDPRVASVDPVTGAVHARRPGTATISVSSGGVGGSVTVTVTVTKS